MFVCCCLVLHNLILCLEGGEFDADYQECLFEAGRTNIAPSHPDIDDDDEHGDQELVRAQQHAETPGQQFHRQLITCLFDSSLSGAMCRPK